MASKMKKDEEWGKGHSWAMARGEFLVATGPDWGAHRIKYKHGKISTQSWGSSQGTMHTQSDSQSSSSLSRHTVKHSTQSRQPWWKGLLTGRSWSHQATRYNHPSLKDSVPESDWEFFAQSSGAMMGQHGRVRSLILYQVYSHLPNRFWLSFGEVTSFCTFNISFSLKI